MAHSNFFSASDLIEDDELRTIDFSLDNSVAPGPYSSVLQNIFSRHCAEIRSHAESTLSSIHQISRKRLKDTLVKQNNDLFGFLQRPDRTPHTTGIADAIFRRYGHDIPSLHRPIQPISRELNIDISMNTMLADIEQQLQRHGGTNILTLSAQLKWCFTQYRNAGEEILRLEAILTQKMEVLDKLHQRMPIISGLSSNDALPELIDSFSKYLEKTFQESKFEETYIQLAEVYKKWATLREIISLQQAVTDTTEPTCSICLNEPIAFSVVPCGHTFCTGCSRKMNMNCYLCRGVIREKLKLYFN
jgi:Zinc finger, C3HC4 type (RING finger)